MGSGKDTTAAALTVRKHRAPKGALRPSALQGDWSGVWAGQKAPSAKRCIKTCCCSRYFLFLFPRQKAPSAKRCIKTHASPVSSDFGFQRQKAPSAKRCIKTGAAAATVVAVLRVRKHRAPKGALRHVSRPPSPTRARRQKAPSAKRCIKTQARRFPDRLPRPCQKAPSAKRCIKTRKKRNALAIIPTRVRKHRAPKGALRRCHVELCLSCVRCQKAPSAKRCIKTLSTDLACDACHLASESTERQKVH